MTQFVHVYNAKVYYYYVGAKLIRYALVCSKYEDFLFRGSILVSKLMQQGYSSRKLQTTFRKFYRRHTDIIYKFDTVLYMLNKTNCD